MKTYKFKYLEVSIAGTFEREWMVEAKTEKSAWSKFYQMQGNRDFMNPSLIAA